MTTSEIIKKFAEENGLTEAKAKTYFNSFRDILMEAVITGEAQVHGFGTFRVKEYVARTGVNPRTGEKITIPANKKVKFTASTMLTCQIV